MLWETPIYRFRVPADTENEESINLKEIVIDVTGSAPPFSEPSENLKSVLKEVFTSSSLTRIDTVLEFGAAKLKNIPFILEQGKTVCAVEFEELTKNPVTKSNIDRCESYGNRYQKLVFPNPFITDDKKFDLVLLANVLPVMPVFAERVFALQLIYDKVKNGKYVLWVAQREGSTYKKIREQGKNVCGDGIWMGANRYFKTFYKYHNPEDLDELMALCGFKLVKRFPVSDDARLYQKKEHNILSGILTKGRIESYMPTNSSIQDPTDVKPKAVRRNGAIEPILPNPKALSIESLYIEKIKNLREGQQDAEMFHRLMSYALARIFRGSLRNMEIKLPIDEGVKIIDTVFTNCAEKGFFHNLQRKIDSTYVIVEAKNIAGDPTNIEFDQLNGRLTPNHGRFGILACRKVDDEAAVYKRCQTYLDDHYILFLTSDEIIEMLEYFREDDYDEINDLMDDKLRKLLFRTG